MLAAAVMMTGTASAVGQKVAVDFAVDNLVLAHDPATGIKVTVDIPGGLAFLDGNITYSSFGVQQPLDATGVAVLNDLQPGQGADIELVFLATSSGHFDFSASLTDAQGDTLTSTAAADVNAPADGADLSAQETSSPPVAAVGEDQTRTITVTNSGQSVGYPRFWEKLPPNVVFASGDPGVTANNGLATGSLNPLGPGQSASVSFVVKPKAPGVGSGSLLVGDEVNGDANPGNNTAVSLATVQGAAGNASVDLSISDAGTPSPVEPGKRLVYTIVASNQSASSPATGVLAADLLPPGVSFVSATDSNGNSLTPASDGLLVDSIGSLAAGQSVTLAVVVTPPVIGTLTNTAYVVGNERDDDVTNNLSTATSRVEFLKTLPESTVSALPALTRPDFTVSWTGSDAGGSGIANYDVYVSDNGGPFTAWSTATTQTSAIYHGVFGHAYAFYSVATDAAGNRQPTPAAAQASTQSLVKDANGQYVAAVYQDVLGRTPDASGLDYWTTMLDSGAAVSSVANEIAHSDEYYAAFVIVPAYSKLLGRSADDAGVKHWTALMQSGLTDQQLEADLVSSDEFFKAAGGTNTAWIDAVYKLLLGRAADAGGEAFWNERLSGGDSLNQAAQGIAGSQENNTQLIEADYFHYLGRAADSAGLDYWLKQFASGKTNEDVIAGFTGADEYYKEHAR